MIILDNRQLFIQGSGCCGCVRIRFAHGIKKDRADDPAIGKYQRILHPLTAPGETSPVNTAATLVGKLCKQNDRRNQTPGRHLLHNGSRAS